MYEEHSSFSLTGASQDVSAALEQVASHVPLKVFRKQGLSEVRVISEKTLNELVEKAVDAEAQKRFEEISGERDEHRARSEDLSRQLEELKEGSGDVEGLEQENKALKEEVARLRGKSGAGKSATFTASAAGARTSITAEKYEEKLNEVIDDILEGARGTLPVELFENIKENLSTQLIEKFPHNTYPIQVVSRSESAPSGGQDTASAAAGAAHPRPSSPFSSGGPMKSGSLFHKLVESNVEWRHKQKTKQKEQGEKEASQ